MKDRGKTSRSSRCRRNRLSSSVEAYIIVEPMLTDEELLERFRKSRDRGALQTLIERYQQSIFNAALRILGDHARAEDATQEAFLQVIRSALTFRPGSSVKPWLYRIVVNSALKQIRSERRIRRREQDARSSRSEGMNAVDDETQAALQKEVAGLPVEQRLAVVLHYCQNLSHREIAEALDCPEGTVASRISGGMERLKKAFAATSVLAAVGSIEQALSAAVQSPVSVSLAAALGHAAQTASLMGVPASIKIAGFAVAALLAAGLWVVLGHSPGMEVVYHTRPPSSVLWQEGNSQIDQQKQQAEQPPQLPMPVPPGPAEPVVQTPAILGRLLTREERTPIAGATVILEQGRKQHRTTSDEGGYYLFDNLEAGPAVLKIVDPDGRMIEGPAVQLKAGEFERHPGFLYSPKNGLEPAPKPPSPRGKGT